MSLQYNISESDGIQKSCQRCNSFAVNTFKQPPSTRLNC